MTDTVLNDEQKARAEALAVARRSLANPGAFGTALLPKRFVAQDLVALAEWVLEGFEEESDESQPRAVVIVPDEDMETITSLNAANVGAQGVLFIPTSVPILTMDDITETKAEEPDND